MTLTDTQINKASVLMAEMAALASAMAFAEAPAAATQMAGEALVKGLADLATEIGGQEFRNNMLLDAANALSEIEKAL